MLVTVIIPVKERTISLKTAIESVFYQTYKNIELIVIDDGSEIDIKKYISQYLSRIKFIQLSSNNGVSYARNEGIKAANGDYVAFLDSDDIWLPSKIQIQLEYLNKSSLSICHTDEFWYKKNSFVNQGSRHQKYGGKILEEIVDFCRISPSSIMIKKSVFNVTGIFDVSMKACEDYDLWLRIALRFTIGYLPVKTLIKRSLGDSQLSLTEKNLEFLRFISLGKFLYKCYHQMTYLEKTACIKELQRKYDIVSKGIRKRGNNYD